MGKAYSHGIGARVRFRIFRTADPANDIVGTGTVIAHVTDNPPSPSQGHAYSVECDDGQTRVLPWYQLHEAKP